MGATFPTRRPAPNSPAREERRPLGARIRDVEQAPDGSIYVLTDEDDGKVRRLRPAR